MLQKRSLYTAALAGGLALCLVLTFSLQRFAQSCALVRQDTLRLHVLADSDAPADQDLKLLVRDAVLAEADALLSGAQDREEALTRVRCGLPRLQSAAVRAVARAGSRQSVRVGLEECWFAATAYPAGTLPPGQYTALRVVLGSGAGHNWFCVLYPGLCLAACSAQYPTQAENELVVGDYALRFAVVEAWQRLRGETA